MFAMIVGYSFMLGPGTEAPKAEKPKVVQSVPMTCKNGVCTPAKVVRSKGLFKSLLRR